MESLKNKRKLSEFDLLRIKDVATTYFKDLSPDKRMGANAFLSFCWVKAVNDCMLKNGYTDIELITKEIS